MLSMPWLTIDTVLLLALAVVTGAAFGSFANVVLDRVPRRRSLFGTSACDGCGAPIAWYDNVPILGWLLLHGRCRRCAARIGIRVVIVETSFALAAFLVAYRFIG